MLKHAATIEQIALYLGAPWKVNRTGEPSSWRAEIIDGTGRALVFWLDTNKAKFNIGGAFPRNIAVAYRDDHKTIGVSVTRPPKDIAADISRRLLPHYLEAFDKAKIRFQEQQEKEQAIDLIAESLVKVSGGHISQHSSQGQRTVYFTKGQAEIYGHSQEVTLTLHSLSVELAIKIAALVCTLPAPIQYEVQQYTLCDGWVNTWCICEDGIIESMQVFDSEEEAQAELDEFFSEIAEEIESGERQPDNGYAREDFRIVPLTP